MDIGALTMQVVVDQQSYDLVVRCAHALAENDLPFLIDEMCEAGSFAESLETRSERGVMHVTLGLMTELVLRECIDVAQRKGWPQAKKAEWLRLMMKVAGVVHTVGGE